MENKRTKKIINFILFIFGIIIISLTFNIFCVPNNYVTGDICMYSVRKKGGQEDSGVFLTQYSGNLTFITSRYI